MLLAEQFLVNRELYNVTSEEWASMITLCLNWKVTLYNVHTQNIDSYQYRKVAIFTSVILSFDYQHRTFLMKAHTLKIL